MSKELSCNQIFALLSFYAEGTLNPVLHNAIKKHLNSCPKCMNDYKKLLDNVKIEVKNEKNNLSEKQYLEFKTNLSAYADNELDNEDNIKIKKIAISNPSARKDLENIFLFKKILNNSFEKTKNNSKDDFSKAVINQIKYEMNLENSVDKFYKIAILFMSLIFFLAVSLFVMLYF